MIQTKLYSTNISHHEFLFLASIFNLYLYALYQVRSSVPYLAIQPHVSLPQTGTPTFLNAVMSILWRQISWCHVCTKPLCCLHICHRSAHISFTLIQMETIVFIHNVRVMSEATTFIRCAQEGSYYERDYIHNYNVICPGHIFTKQNDVLPQDLVKSRSRAIRF